MNKIIYENDYLSLNCYDLIYDTNIQRETIKNVLDKYYNSFLKNSKIESDGVIAESGRELFSVFKNAITVCCNNNGVNNVFKGDFIIFTLNNNRLI